MKELSIIITVTPIGKMRQSSYKFLADSFTFTPAVENSSAGTIYNCSKDFTIELPGKDALTDFSYARNCTVRFRDSEGKWIELGTPDIPAVVSMCPYLTSASLKIECKMLHSPFLS